jgi:hypothetical protein
MASPNGKMDIDKSPNHKSCVNRLLSSKFDTLMLSILGLVITLLTPFVPEDPTGLFRGSEKGESGVETEVITMKKGKGVAVVTEAARERTGTETDLASDTETERGTKKDVVSGMGKLGTGVRELMIWETVATGIETVIGIVNVRIETQIDDEKEAMKQMNPWRYGIRRSVPNERSLMMRSTNPFLQPHLQELCRRHHHRHPGTVLAVEPPIVEIAHVKLTVRMVTDIPDLPVIHEMNLKTHPAIEGKGIMPVGMTDVCYQMTMNLLLIAAAT